MGGKVQRASAAGIRGISKRVSFPPACHPLPMLLVVFLTLKRLRLSSQDTAWSFCPNSVRDSGLPKEMASIGG